MAGVTYGAKKDSALEHYQKALKLNPDSAIARVEYANGLIMLFGKARMADAEKLYKEAAACKPADAMERLDVELARSELDSTPPGPAYRFHRPLAARAGSRSPDHGHGASSVVSTSFSNSGAKRAMTRSGSGHSLRSVMSAELHLPVVGQDRHAHPDVPGLRHPEHETLDLRAGEDRAAAAGRERSSSPRYALRATAPAASWSCSSFGPAPIAASRPSVRTGW